MFLKAIRKIILPLIFLLILSFGRNFVYSQTDTSTPGACGSVPGCENLNCNDYIVCLGNKISEKKGQEKTLSSQIAVMDNQINLTQARIYATRQQIADLTLDIDTTTKKISNLADSLDKLAGILINRIVATYEVGTIQPMQILLTSNSVSNFLLRLNYLRIAQMHDKKLIYDTQQAKNDYANQKDIFETKKKKVETLKAQLESYTAQLNQEKQSKRTLLDVTKNDESRYQQLLQEAQAQINAFKSFAASRGGAQILPVQPSPDGWYYNQRDERWGRNVIGYSSEQVWDVGCLVTATAMVMKQHGVNVTPSDVAANPSYYFSSTAYMLLPWIGGKFSSTWGFDQSDIDNKLANGPVIVGLRAGVYGMHFVVLKSGSGGNYTMNDPWNGPDLKFSDYYSTSQIFQYGVYNG